MIDRRRIIPGFMLSAIAAFCGVTLAFDDDAVVDSLTARVEEKQVHGRAHLRLVEVPMEVSAEKLEAFRNAEFYRLVFLQDGKNVEHCRLRLKAELEQVIEKLNQLCNLSDAQKRNLKLAGTVDYKRFFTREALARTRFHAAGGYTDEQRPELVGLSAKASIGLLDDNSFFSKSVIRGLTQEQRSKIDVWRHAIRTQLVEQVMEEVERMVTLEPSQQESLKEVLWELSPSICSFENLYLSVRNSERMALLCYLWKMRDDKVKPLLTESQWETLARPLEEYHRFDAFLAQRGLIESDLKNLEGTRP